MEIDVLMSEFMPRSKPEPTIDPDLALILPASQKRVLEEMRNSEEYEDILSAFKAQADRLPFIPQECTTDGIPETEKTVWLHFFYGVCDWFVLELSEYQNERGETKHEFFGLIRVDPQFPELGYQQLEELMSFDGIELDAYWHPKTLAQVREEYGMND